MFYEQSLEFFQEWEWQSLFSGGEEGGRRHSLMLFFRFFSS